MLTHLIHCCIDFYFFTVVNNNKKDISVCNQILVCQKKKKREKEKIKKGHIFFDSMHAMYYCMQPEGRSGVGTPQIAKSFLPWKVVRWMESLLHTCFFKGVYLLCVLGCSYYTTIHTNFTSAIIQKWLGKSKTLALEGCVPLGNIHPQGQGGI